VPALIRKKIPIQFAVVCHLAEPYNFPGVKRQVFRVLMISTLIGLCSFQLIPLFISYLTATTGRAS
jgi:hypothetical protein